MKKNIFCFLLCFLSIGSLIAQVPSYVPTSGLVGWWPFNGNANDESGNGNNGTVTGAQLTNDRFGTNKAYSFNGDSDYIKMLNPGPLGITSRSVSVWVKTTDSSTYSIVLSWGGNDLSGQDFNLWSNYDCIGFTFDINFSARTYNSNFTNGQWNHYVVVFDNSIDSTISSIKVYQNGSLLSTVCASTSNNGIINTVGSNPIYVGRYHGLSKDFLNGSVDDIGIWNRALTESEITTLYQSILGIHTENIGLGVSIYPNPTGESKEFLVRFADNPQQDIHIELLDILGSVLYSNRLQAGSESCTIPVHSLSSGMYMIRVRMNNEVYMEKVIVN